MLYMKGGLFPYNQSLLQIFFLAYQKYSSDSLHLRVPSNSLTILGTDGGWGSTGCKPFCRILLPEAQKQDRHVIWALHFGFM